MIVFTPLNAVDHCLHDVVLLVRVSNVYCFQFTVATSSLAYAANGRMYSPRVVLQ